MRGATILAATVVALLAATGTAQASTGDVLKALPARVCHTPDSPADGIASKGNNLLITCPTSAFGPPVIYEVKKTNGKVVATHPIADLGQATVFGIAYNPKSARVFACVTPDFVTFRLELIDLATNGSTQLGATADCTGGLEYDQAHRLWSTPYFGTSVLQIDPTTGATMVAHPVGAALGGCGTAGVAIEGGSIVFSSAGFDSLDCGLFADKLATGAVQQVLPAGITGNIVDIVCDNKFFAATHTTALWSVSADDFSIVAREAPGSGGTTTPKCK